MSKIIIDEDKFGKEYLNALREVLKVRENKRHQYKDTYMFDDLLFLKYQLENKLKRLTLQMKNDKLIDNEESIETAKDSCIDICNYSLFIIAKILEGDKR